METQYKLKDKTQVIVKNLEPSDIDKSHNFFQSFPAKQRIYFRSNVDDRNHIINRIKSCDEKNIIRRIVVSENQIIGDGSLEIETETWKSGEAQLRLVVRPEFIGNGAQYVLAKDLFEIADDKKINKLVTKFMRPQAGLQKIYEKLGFKIEGMLPNYVVDHDGKEQDMVIMIATLDDLRKAYQFVGDWIHGDQGSIGAGEI